MSSWFRGILSYFSSSDDGGDPEPPQPSLKRVASETNPDLPYRLFHTPKKRKLDEDLAPQRVQPPLSPVVPNLWAFKPPSPIQTPAKVVLSPSHFGEEAEYSFRDQSHFVAPSPYPELPRMHPRRHHISNNTNNIYSRSNTGPLGSKQEVLERMEPFPFPKANVDRVAQNYQSPAKQLLRSHGLLDEEEEPTTLPKKPTFQPTTPRIPSIFDQIRREQSEMRTQSYLNQKLGSASTLPLNPEESWDELQKKMSQVHVSSPKPPKLSSLYATPQKPFSAQGSAYYGLTKSPPPAWTSTPPDSPNVETSVIPPLFANERTQPSMLQLTKQTKTVEVSKHSSEHVLRNGGQTLALLRQLAQEDMKAHQPITTPIAPLTEEEKALIAKLRKGQASVGRVEGYDVAKCINFQWLGDEVVNAYVELMKKRNVELQGRLPSCYFFNTFFYVKWRKFGFNRDLARWTAARGEKPGVHLLYEFEKIMIPINHEDVHWACVVVQVQRKCLQYYDSIASEREDVLDRYLQADHRDKRGEDHPDLDTWPYEYPDTPQQVGGVDCGVFACKVLDFLSRGSPLSFSQEHIAHFRKRIVLELHSEALRNELP